MTPSFITRGPSTVVAFRHAAPYRVTIDYQFTVEDPKTWTRPWSGSNPMRKVPGPMFEYACHEGNYGMVGILSGHRADEKAAEEASKKGSSK